MVLALEPVAGAGQRPSLSSAADPGRLPPDHRPVEGRRALDVTGIETVEDHCAGVVNQARALVLLGLPETERCPLGVGADGHPAGVHEVEGLGDDASAGIADLGRGLVGALDPEVGVPHGDLWRCLGDGSDAGDITALHSAGDVKDRRALRLAAGDEVLGLTAGPDPLELPPEETAVELERGLGIRFAHVHPAGDAGNVSIAFGQPRLPLPGATCGASCALTRRAAWRSPWASA